MKKLSPIIFVCVLLFEVSAWAGIVLADKKVELGGHARFRYEFENDTDFGSVGADANDTRDFVLTRLRPYFKIMPDEKLVIYFEPQFTGGWGERDNTLNAVTVTGATPATTSGALNDPALGVHQGFIEYLPHDWLAVKIGRQEISYGDELVIGPVGWHNIGR